eukprot:7006894-Prymnesium_polylepis.1
MADYFAPGSLRLPHSPLVRKYLELSNDVHLLESLLGEGSATREAHTEAIASAVAAGAMGGGASLPPGASPAERAALAIALADKEGARSDGE